MVDHRSSEPISTATPAVGRVMEMSEAQSVERLEVTPVGRLGFSAGDQPVVLPVSFAWVEDSIVYRTMDDQLLAVVADGRKVCFEVDHWDTETQTGWSVLVTGVAREVEDWAEKEALEQIGLVPWTRTDWRPVWIRIDPNRITGRLIA